MAEVTRTHRGTDYVVSAAHPAADLFPWLGEDELQAMADDIAASGQRYKIVRLADGRLIDGRNRELACRVAGVEPQYRTEEMVGAEVLAFVVSANCRRDLTPSQRAMIAAELTALGGRSDVQTDCRAPVRGQKDGETRVSRADAAGTMGVSQRTVTHANKVKREAPELVKAVTEGKLDVTTAAAVADLAPAVRKKVAKAPDVKGAARAALRKTSGPLGAITLTAEDERQETAKRAPAERVLDALGGVVPDCLADTFGDPMLGAALERLEAVRAELTALEHHVVRTLSRKAEFWPYALYGEAAKSIAAAFDRVTEATAQLGAGVPYCVCPKCKGVGCKECRNSGAWPEHRYEGRDQYGDAP